MKWILAIKTAYGVYKAIRKHQKIERVKNRLEKYEHEQGIGYAELIAHACNEIKPTGSQGYDTTNTRH